MAGVISINYIQISKLDPRGVGWCQTPKRRKCPYCVIHLFKGLEKKVGRKKNQSSKYFVQNDGSKR